MASAMVKQAVDVPADAMWRLVSAFGDTSWMPAGTPVRVEGSGPGMTRNISAGPDRVIQERLESVDAAARTLVYTIPQNVPFPATDYRATMRVTPSGAGCELEWRATFTPAGAPEAEVASAIQGMYGLMIGWLAARAKAL
ncbi:MAG TPA: SRPBCC family protein [Myxococcota bacterium]|jgi:hypothetical protein